MITGMDIPLKPFETQDIVKAKWKQLVKLLQNNHYSIYWLSSIPEKSANLMQITLLIDMHASYTQSGYKIITAKYSHGTEKIDTVFVPADYAERLAFLLLPDTYHREIKHDKAGRPKEYSLADARRVLSMRNQGLTIREIADKLATSTSQIQRLLNRIQTKEQRAAKAQYIKELKKKH